MEPIDIILQMNDVHQIVDQLSVILQRAVIIEDKNFELVAYSSPNEFSFDSLQQRTILTKRCPLFVIERLKKEGIVEQLQHEDRPLRIDIEEIGFYKRIVISLKHDEKLYGYLWVYEAEAPLPDTHLTSLITIANHVGKLMYERHNEVENDLQTFIWKLMNHEFLGEAEVRHEAKSISYDLPKQFSALAVSVRNANFLSILGKAKNIFLKEGIAYYLGKGTEIIGIVHSDLERSSAMKTVQLKEEILNMLSEDEKQSLFIGIGNEYNHVQHIRKSYLEALEVIETMVFLHIDIQPTFYFHELGMYRYIKQMYKKNVSEQYRNKNIVSLMKKDAESNSELLLTLWSYLQHDCKVGHTAEQLFIHPNTLSYRIKQIQELTTIDFTNVHEKTELYAQLLILEFVPDYREFYKKII